MNQLAIVGCEASGKTVFMSALTDHYRASLVPENQAANRFVRFGQRQMRALRLWPPATNPGRTLEMDWSLRRDGEILTQIKMLEFGGETFRAAFREDDTTETHRQAVKDLMAYLSEADFIIVLVSLKELFREPGEATEEEFDRDTESIWVTRGLLDFIHEKIPLAGVAIGLTQADRYRKELAAAGGSEKALAAHWPSIRAVAANVPVVEVASVSGTDDEGRPEEDYRTDGVLPIMREMARSLFGSSEKLLAELSAIRAELENLDPNEAAGPYNSKARKFAAKLTDLARVSTIGGEDRAREIIELGTDLKRFRERLKTVRKPKDLPPKPPAKRPPAARRAFWLALLLAATIPFAIEYGNFNMLPQPVAKPVPPPVLPAPNVVTNEVPVVTSEIVSATASVPPAIETNAAAVATTPEPIVAASNELMQASIETNQVSLVTEQAAVEPPQATNIVAQTTPATLPGDSNKTFRVWHDHKGKAIEACWLSTAADGQAVFLETRKGRNIRAVLYKLSEEDRAYIQSQLSNTAH